MENNRNISQIPFANFIACNRSVLIKLGPFVTIILGDLIDWENYLIKQELIQPGEYFYMLQSLLKNRTGFSEDVQTSSTKILQDLNFIQVSRKGIPAKNWYRIDRNKIQEWAESGFRSKRNLDSVQSGISLSKPIIIEPIPESLDPKDSNESFLSKDSGVSPKAGETDVHNLGLNSTQSLIKRNKSISIEFEVTPRQRYRKDTLDIINYWNSSPGLPHHHMPAWNNQGYAKPTKTFTDIVSIIEKVLDGKLFIGEGLTDNKKYSKEEIISGIDKYKLIATNLNYRPVNKSIFKNLGLGTFFYNRFASSIKSQFLHCLENEPEPVTFMVKKEKEKNPENTRWLKEFYRDKILLGASGEFNQKEENDFIIGANRLHDRIRELHPRLNMPIGAREWCEKVIDSLINRWGIDKVVTGNVRSSHTYTEVLTRYLIGKGRIDRRGTPDIITKENSPYQPDRGDIL